MALELYVNIDNSYTATGTGTALSPYNWTQLGTHFGAVDENADYYIKGKRTGTDSDLTLYHNIWPSQTNTLRLLPWDLSAYGPWVLDDPTGYIIIGDRRASVNLTVVGLSAKAATIDLRCSVYDGSAITYKTCWFDTDYLSFAAGGSPSGNSYDLYGCTLKAKQIEWEYGYGSTVTDCVFPLSDSTEFLLLGAGYATTTTFTSCHFGNNLSDIVDAPSTTLGDLNLVDCEAGYDFGTAFPSGGDCTVANQDAYLYSLFNIPNIDHQSRWTDNDYDTGLFGESRLGVGAFYFKATSQSRLLGMIT